MVIEMREFFIFNIKDEFKALYQEKPSILYNIFEQIYFLKKEDVQYGYSLFQQLTKKIEKEKLDRSFFLEFHQNIPYSKREDIHYYNDPTHDEITTIEIKKAFMRLSTNYYDPFFFRPLNTIGNNYFVCDFKNQDFFFLEMHKVLV